MKYQESPKLKNLGEKGFKLKNSNTVRILDKGNLPPINSIRKRKEDKKYDKFIDPKKFMRGRPLKKSQT